MSGSRMILIHVTTVPQTLGFIVGQADFMRQHGFEVHAVSSPGPLLDEFGHRERAIVHAIAMTRRISPKADSQALFSLCRLFIRLRPTVVHAHTPKASLLSMIAAFLVGVPVRIYNNHGLVTTATGLTKHILRWSEVICGALAHRVICDSGSVAAVAKSQRLWPEHKVRVLLSGSVNGIDSRKRFNPDNTRPLVRQSVRERYGIPADAVVIGFVGRIVRDKGLRELGEAWNLLAPRFCHLELLVVGAPEDKDPIDPATHELFRSDPRIHLTGGLADTVPMYAAMDLLVLPTYREGLGVVLLEAGAMALPAVASEVTGCVDVIIPGKTGLLVPPRDAKALAEAIATYVENPTLRQEHGKAARERVVCCFQQEPLWAATLAEYRAVMA